MSRLKGLVKQLRVFTRKGRIERELDEELRVHLEMETEKNLREGMSPPEARRAALVAFGGVERTKERVRDERWTRWVEYFVADVRYAVRTLRRTPGFTVTIILVLALGIGANSAMFSLVDHLFLRQPGAVVDPQAMGQVWAVFPGPEVAGYLPALGDDAMRVIRSELRGTASMAERMGYSEGIDYRTGPRVFRTTSNFFSLLGVRVARGHFFTAGEETREAPVAIVSYRYWQRMLAGDPRVLGRSIKVGPKRYTVIGVAPRNFSGIGVEGTDIWLPLPPDSDAVPILRLAPGTSRQLVGSILTPALRRSIFQGYREKPKVVVTSLVFAADRPGSLWGSLAVTVRVAGVAAVILLIALANVATLLLMRGARRRKEIAVRLALGVSRRRVCRQLLTEAALLTSVGGAGALALGVWGGAVVRAYFMPQYRLTYPILDARLLSFTLVVAIVGGLLAALVPAIQASGPDLTRWLKSGGHEAGHDRSGIRSALVVGQAGLSMVLLVGAGLFIRSLASLRGIPLGIDVAPLTIAETYFPHTDSAVSYLPRFQDEADRLSALPGVQGVAVSAMAPLRGELFMPMFLPGGDTVRAVGGNDVGPGFFRTVGMRIVDGRDFTNADVATSKSVIVVSESMAHRLWPGEHAIGKCLMLVKPSGSCAEVVGVVTDANLWSIKPEPEAQYYRPITQEHWGRNLALTVRSKRKVDAAVGRALRDGLAQSLPATSELDVQTLAAALRPRYRQWDMGMVVFSAMGLLALLVSALGMYSVIGYAVTQRMHELGIRAALGAGRRRIVAAVVFSGLRLATIGVVLGIAVSLALGRLVASLLFETSSRNPIAILGSALVLALAAMAASLLPAWRAAHVDPAITLRTE